MNEPVPKRGLGIPASQRSRTLGVRERATARLPEGLCLPPDNCARTCSGTATFSLVTIDRPPLNSPSCVLSGSERKPEAKPDPERVQERWE
jgi:hypothetical protein